MFRGLIYRGCEHIKRSVEEDLRRALTDRNWRMCDTVSGAPKLGGEETLGVWRASRCASGSPRGEGIWVVFRCRRIGPCGTAFKQ